MGKYAGRGTRTPDPLITNQVHYQLCYAGVGTRIVPGQPAQGTLDEPVATFVRNGPVVGDAGSGAVPSLVGDLPPGQGVT
jgi:hypothetical protein